MSIKDRIFSQDTIGWAGSLSILIGYFLLIQGVVSSTSLEYIVLNFLGSVLLGINMYQLKATGPLFLQLCFITISLYGFWKIFI